MTSASFYLFVYGTLREGQSAAHMLAGCERIGDATVAGSMYDIAGRHPAIMLYGDGKVHGEVWRCPAPLLTELDRYEGVGDGMFRRVAVRVGMDPTEDAPAKKDGPLTHDELDELSAHEGLPCWTYVAGPRLAWEIRPENLIAEGRWR